MVKSLGFLARRAPPAVHLFVVLLALAPAYHGVDLCKQFLSSNPQALQYPSRLVVKLRDYSSLASKSRAGCFVYKLLTTRRLRDRRTLRRRSRRTFDPGSALTVVIRYLVYLSGNIASYHSSAPILSDVSWVVEWAKLEHLNIITDKKYINNVPKTTNCRKNFDK